MLERLAERFELVWATGWEEKANEYLPCILELPFKELPVLTFDGRAVFGSSHWKLDAIDEYAGDRPAAWIDDNMDGACELWADAARRAPPCWCAPTPPSGLTDEHVELLLFWADEVGIGERRGLRPSRPRRAAPLRRASRVVVLLSSAGRSASSSPKAARLAVAAGRLRRSRSPPARRPR